MITPLHTATVGGHQLRFFRTPKDDGLPDFPWHIVDDLHRALGLNREQRKILLHSFRTRGQFQTVATADGIVTVAPHCHAQGCIAAAVETGRAPASIRLEYDRAGAEALKKVVPLGLVFPSDAWLAWMKAAMNRWEN